MMSLLYCIFKDNYNLFMCGDTTTKISEMILGTKSSDQVPDEGIEWGAFRCIFGLYISKPTSVLELFKLKN